MRIVKPNLTVGQSGPEVYNLQEVLLWLASKKAFAIDGTNSELINEVSCCEMGTKTFGKATYAMALLFCTSHAIQPGVDFIVDKTVADSINAKLSEYFKAITVGGRVGVKNGTDKKIGKSISVDIAIVSFNSSAVVFTASTDENGNYTSSFNEDLSSAGGGIKGIQAIANIDGKAYPSEVVYSYGQDVTINIDVDNSAVVVVSEFSEIIAALNAVVGPTAIKDVNISDPAVLTQLAKEVSEPEVLVEKAILASKLSGQMSSWGASLFYGLLRQNMPSDLEVMLHQPKEMLRLALTVSVANNIIDAIDQPTIDGFISGIVKDVTAVLTAQNVTIGGKTSATFNILNYILNNTDNTNKFLSEYFEFPPSQAGQSFWDHLSTMQEFTTAIPLLKAALTIATLAGSNAAITARVIDILKGQARPGDPTVTVIPNNPQPELLIAFEGAEWHTIVESARLQDAANFFYPDGIVGTSDLERDESYAEMILRNFSSTYPMQYAGYNIDKEQDTPFPALKAGLSTFLSQNPGFDFRVVSLVDISDYNFSGIEDKDLFVNEVATMQRLMHLTTDYSVISAFARAGLISSVHIISTPRPDFVNNFAGVIGSVKATQSVYMAARAAVHTSMLVAFSTAEFNMLKFDGVSSEFHPMSGFSTGPYADWRNLFGALDSCNCAECQSIYSPSAYLVDVLKFLSDSNVAMRDQLINYRRKDIPNIQLTCKNTNTPVPYIDIVNELLEDVISTSAASSSSSYTTYARQTIAGADYQRASPEYVNTSGENITILGTSGTTFVASPYPILKAAKYPWSLPYNYYKREIDTSLSLLRVKPYELFQRFGTNDILDAWQDNAYCYHYLGISQEEWAIITTSPPSTSDLYQAYGLTTSGTRNIPDPQVRGTFIAVTPTNWISVLMGRVDVFLQQTGLEYIELLELLECYNLNPLPRNLYIEKSSASYADDTCQLDQLHIKEVTTFAGVNFRQALFRFVRLAKALRWSFYELDRALNCLVATSIDAATFNKLVHIKYLTSILSISVDAACLFWNDLNVESYRDFNSSDLSMMPTQYESVFRNPLLIDISVATYPFQPIGTTPAATSLDTIQTYFAGIFNIGGTDLSDLLANIYAESPAITGTTVTLPDMTFLTRVYREVVMLKALGFSVSEWIFAKQWLANHQYYGSATAMPYDAYAKPFVDTYTTLRFVSFAKLIKNTGSSTSQLDFILRDKPVDAVTDAAANTDMANVLTTLRNDLLNAWDPNYNPTTDTDSSELETRLRKIMPAADASHLVSIINNTSGSYTSADSTFISTTMSFFLPSTAGSTLLSTSFPPTVKRGYVFGSLNVYVQQNILKPLIVNDVADKYRVADDVAFLLLDSCITNVMGTGLTGFDVLMDPTFVTSGSGATPVIDRWAYATYHNQFQALLLLQKAGMLVNNYGLVLTDVQHLWDYQSITDIVQISSLPVRLSVGAIPAPAGSGDMPVVFRQMENLLRWMMVRAFLNTNMPIIYTRLHTLMTSGSSKTDFVNDITTAFGMSSADAIQLLGTSGSGALGATYSAYYQKPQLYLRIIDCLEIQHLMPSTVSDLINAAMAVGNPASQTDANTVIQLVRAQYDSNQWLSVVRPVSDQTRVERRDAMLTYLLVTPPNPYQYQWYTYDDIYSTLMVDIQMMSCMNTSRIALAISTIQLWVDRILLGLEKYYSSSTGTMVLLRLSNEEAREWELWRKLYRVWEANRKVFVYPENYILPELRDNKSPFFKEVEDFLNQNDLNDSNIEDAYTAYLEKLEEVSHLQIVAMYRETTEGYYDPSVSVDEIVHVFGRTASVPHIYYYRKRVDSIWTAWEKTNLPIDSDHHVAVMWRGRLRIYWLTFTKVLASGPHVLPGIKDGPYPVPDAYQWKIDIHWSELKNDLWTGPQVGRTSLYSYPMNEASPQSLAEVNYFSWAHNGFIRDWFFDGALDRQKKNIYFFSQFTTDGDLTFIVQEKVVKLYGPALNHRFMVSSYPYPGMIAANNFPGALLQLLNTEGDWEASCYQPGLFYAKYNGIFAMPMENPFVYTMFFRLHWWHQYKLQAAPYHYVGSTSSGLSHYPDLTEVQLLSTAPDVDAGKPDGKYVLFPMNGDPYAVGDASGAPKIMMPYFFYKDYDNSFFVEKIIKYAIIPVTAGAGYVFVPGYGTISVSYGIYVPAPVLAAAGYHSIPGVYYLKFPIPCYRFHNYYHNKVIDFRERLYKLGLDGLLDGYFIAGLLDNMHFTSVYSPTAIVDTRYPDDKVNFDYDSSFSVYNWELFFHIPMLIANKLSQNQQFFDARRWYHYVFNPTAGNGTSVAQFWNFGKFYDSATTIPSPMAIMTDPNLALAVRSWAMNPFNPHLIARTRISAYMKNTVMMYLDNLIAWGDNLFEQDTAETINEATQLYVLAAQLLGPKPPDIPARVLPAVQTFSTLTSSGAGALSAFGNALVHFETLILPSGITTSGTSSYSTTGMYFFCLIPNDKLLAYWDTLADRLFKIRNCMTIDGTVQDLPLFAPPIDPALLVSAAASGVSLASAVAGLNAPLPYYRFNVLAQKANEITELVKSLGSQLLSALEKKDAEHLAVLRNTQELMILNAVTQVKEAQIAEASKQIDVLSKQLGAATRRQTYYKGLLDGGYNGSEKLQLDMYTVSMILHGVQAVCQGISTFLHPLPDISVGIAAAIEEGGDQIGSALDAAANALGSLAALSSDIGAKAGLRGSYDRRDKEWVQQLGLADWEIEQVNQQVLAAQIRKAIAEMELSNHKLQISNAEDMDVALRTKFTNEELYNWMITQISGTYFMAYRLACDTARRAERTYRNELSIDTSNFIQFGYWDSLHKGLLAGEQLSYDIKQMEMSYLDQNKRRFEMTKNVSLAMLNPDALLVLKLTKSCTVILPEWLFDLDYPGQYMRRIKSISVSIPCVAGPYTTVSCKLSLLNSKYRKDTSLTSGYAENTTGDSRFNYVFGNVEAIATSSAQNDSGMFELNFRDERYLPFEGAGAISTWAIELPPAYAQFDYSSIADVILHVKYTAFDNGGPLQSAAGSYLGSIISGSGTGGASNLFRLFNLRSEFATEWHQLLYGSTNTLILSDIKSRMPYLAQAGSLAINAIEIYCAPGLTVNLVASGVTHSLAEISITSDMSKYSGTASFPLTVPWSITMAIGTTPVTSSDVKDAWMVIYYTA